MMDHTFLKAYATHADFDRLCREAAQVSKLYSNLQSREVNNKKPTLFTTLPEEYVCTPDGMEIDKNGDIIVSCPNFANRKMPGCVIRITKDMEISKWFDVMPHPETGLARNMGIAFDKDYNLYICDNQGWYEEEENIFKGRVLKVIFSEDRSVKETIVVADQMEHPNGIRIKGEYMYLTQSYLHRQKIDSGKLMSCVYRFRLDDRDIQIKNTLEDENIFCTFITENPDCDGLDGGRGCLHRTDL